MGFRRLVLFVVRFKAHLTNVQSTEFSLQFKIQKSTTCLPYATSVLHQPSAQPHQPALTCLTHLRAPTSLLLQPTFQPHVPICNLTSEGASVTCPAARPQSTSPAPSPLHPAPPTPAANLPAPPACPYSTSALHQPNSQPQLAAPTFIRLPAARLPAPPAAAVPAAAIRAPAPTSLHQPNSQPHQLAPPASSLPPYHQAPNRTSSYLPALSLLLSTSLAPTPTSLRTTSTTCPPHFHLLISCFFELFEAPASKVFDVLNVLKFSCVLNY